MLRPRVRRFAVALVALSVVTGPVSAASSSESRPSASSLLAPLWNYLQSLWQEATNPPEEQPRTASSTAPVPGNQDAGCGIDPSGCAK